MVESLPSEDTLRPVHARSRSRCACHVALALTTVVAAAAFFTPRGSILSGQQQPHKWTSRGEGAKTTSSSNSNDVNSVPQSDRSVRTDETSAGTQSIVGVATRAREPAAGSTLSTGPGLAETGEQHKECVGLFSSAQSRSFVRHCAMTSVTAWEQLHLRFGWHDQGWGTREGRVRVLLWRGVCGCCRDVARRKCVVVWTVSCVAWVSRFGCPSSVVDGVGDWNRLSHVSPLVRRLTGVLSGDG